MTLQTSQIDNPTLLSHTHLHATKTSTQTKTCQRVGCPNARIDGGNKARKHNHHENFKSNPGASVDHGFNEVNGAVGKFDHNEQIRQVPDHESYHGY